MSEILWSVTCILKVHSYWQIFAETKHQNFIYFQWELISSDMIFIVWHSMGLSCNLKKSRKVYANDMLQLNVIVSIFSVLCDL